tara:strand:+ start:1090 stop:2019 length:930 start_codon:yes stop_codon:yes gene_type:complete
MINVAIYGLGKIAFDQHIPSINSSKDFKLVAAISSSEHYPEIPKFSSILEMFDSKVKVDAISLCMPPSARFKIAQEAISYKYDLFLEKPPCKSLKECKNLIKSARLSSVTLFAGWHSKYALMISKAKNWIDTYGYDYFEINWKENVNKWHPNQNWITKKNGFGVFDSGMNALSILYELTNNDFFADNVEFYKPMNWDSPIAVKFNLGVKDKICGEANFDFRASEIESWEIKFFSGKNKLFLLNGGQSMFVNNISIKDEGKKLSEYENMYEHFRDTILRKETNFDTRPLNLVEKLYEKANWHEIEEFINI